MRASLEVLAGERSYLYTLDGRPVLLYGDGRPLRRSVQLDGAVREGGTGHPPSQPDQPNQPWQSMG